MSTRELGREDFEDTIANTGLVLVDWWAPWCGPCKTFGPIYERVSDDTPDAVFAKIDTEKEPELATELGIRAIPTLMMFRDGILLFSQAGLIPEAALRDLVRQALELDMDHVRRAIEAQKPEPA